MSTISKVNITVGNVTEELEFYGKTKKLSRSAYDRLSSIEKSNGFMYIVNDPAIENIPFATASVNEIMSLIEDARSGDRDLQSSGWSVGDTRTITLNEGTANAVDYDIVISEFGDYNNSGAIAQFDFVQCYVTGRDYIGSGKGSYENGCVYKYTIPDILQRLPDWLLSVMHPFNLVSTATDGSLKTFENQMLAARSLTEITGAVGPKNGSGNYTGYVNYPSDDGSWVSYYRTGANRIKTNGKSGSASSYWTRTSCYDSCDPVYIISDGTGKYVFNTDARWVNYPTSLFGCF